MDAADIAQKLTELFPTGGKKEDIGPIKAQCDALTLQIQGTWHNLPEALQNRIRDIEITVCRREIPLALHIEPWIIDNDNINDDLK